MDTNIGSFGSRLIREQRVPDGVWSKVVFDEVDWDTGGGFDVATGGFVVGQRAKFHFAAGVRFLAPDVRGRYVELILCKNGEPLEILTRDMAFHKPDSVALSSPETPWAEYARGFTCRELPASLGDVFEVCVRHSFGEPAYLTVRRPGSAGEDAPAERHPIYFIGLWHA
jgi:hypothetical protein